MMLSIVIGIIGGVITTVILMIRSIDKKFRDSLILALVGFLCPILQFIYFLVCMILPQTSYLGNTMYTHIMLSLFEATACLNIASLIIRPQKVESDKELIMTIQVLTYTGTIIAFLGAISFIGFVNIII